MQKRHKDLMRTLVIELRHILVGSIAADGSVVRGDLDRELERLGIAPDGTITPLDALAHPGKDEWLAHRIATAQLVYTAREQRANSRVEIVERAAYSWINRLLALRAMEARGLIDETLRNNPEYEGLPEALFILRQNEPERASAADGGHRAILEDACAAQSRLLPGLFALDDLATALRLGASALLRCMTLVGGSMLGFTLAESDAAFADPDAIGWAYQFYQEEAKARIYSKLGSGGKVTTRAEIAAATQLFTEPYMVKWLLQNSLGRCYHEIHPDSALPATWEYYIKPDELDTSTTLALSSLTLLDPCMGSGHFLREAFDMFVAMYREQHPALTATEIADRILSRHLYGIDLDPRAAQLAALTLFLRAWELLRDERRKEPKPDAAVYIPPAMNLATTPTSLNGGALERHLQRHPQDMPLKPLLEGIFSALGQADILGSLIRPKAYLDHAIAELQRPHTMSLDFTFEEQEVRRTLTELANRDPQGLRQMLLDRIADSFKAESGNIDDVSAALFGREAERGVRLLQLLDRRYAVVVTNPPYMGSKNMDTPLKKYVEKYYPYGKRNLFATFILRCLELCQAKGRIAIVTINKWMFLTSYTELRVGSQKFRGLLKETQIEIICDLGSRAFALDNHLHDGVQIALFNIMNTVPTSDHQLIAFRLIGPRTPEEKDSLMLRRSADITSHVTQLELLDISDTPLIYTIDKFLLALLTRGKKLRDVAHVKVGLQTSDDERFIRYTWEVPNIFRRWTTFTKGGGYCKWFGQNWYHVDWEHSGGRTKAFGKSVLRNVDAYFHPGWSYSLVSHGSIGFRRFDIPGCIGHKGPGVYTEDQSLVAIAQSHSLAFILRTISPQLSFEINTLMQAPLPERENGLLSTFSKISETHKRFLISGVVTERSFADIIPEAEESNIACLLHTIEGAIEQVVCRAYNFYDVTIQTIINDTGTPAGWYPLITGYNALPTLPTNHDLPSLPLKFRLK